MIWGCSGTDPPGLGLELSLKLSQSLAAGSDAWHRAAPMDKSEEPWPGGQLCQELCAPATCSSSHLKLVKHLELICSPTNGNSTNGDLPAVLIM